MLSFPPAVRIWLALAPADLRKGFDALAELVRQYLRDDPLSGHVFVFRNRRSDRIKLLYWDSDGYVIVYKRLEAETFRFPAAEGQAGVTLRVEQAERTPGRGRPFFSCPHRNNSGLYYII